MRNSRSIIDGCTTKTGVIPMGKYLEKAKELRAITDVHYNCAQSVICAFEELTWLDDTTSRNRRSFGSG